MAVSPKRKVDRMVKPMLGQVIECMAGPERVWIEQGDKCIFAGYVGNLRDHDYDRSAQIKKIGIHTDIYRNDYQTVGLSKIRVNGAPVHPDDTQVFRYADLTEEIWTRITLEG